MHPIANFPQVDQVQDQLYGQFVNISQHDRLLVIYGPAGSGKTELLRTTIDNVQGLKGKGDKGYLNIGVSASGVQTLEGVLAQVALELFQTLLTLYYAHPSFLPYALSSERRAMFTNGSGPEWRDERALATSLLPALADVLKQRDYYTDLLIGVDDLEAVIAPRELFLALKLYFVSQRLHLYCAYNSEHFSLPPGAPSEHLYAIHLRWTAEQLNELSTRRNGADQPLFPDLAVLSKGITSHITRVSTTPRDLYTWDLAARSFLSSEGGTGLDEERWQRLITQMAQARRQCRGEQAGGWLVEDWRWTQEQMALTGMQVS